MGRDRHKLLWEGNGQINMSHGQPWLEPNFVFQVHASLFRSQWSVAKVEMFFVAFLRRRCQNGHFYAKSEACFFHQPFSSACCGNAGDAKVKLCDDLVKLYLKSCCYWLYLFAWKRFGGVMATYYRCSFLEFSSFRKMIGLIIVVRRILRGTVHWYGRPLRRNYDLYSVWIVFEIRALAEDRPRRQLFATEFLAHCCRFLPELTLGKIACFSQNGSFFLQNSPFFCKIARFFYKIGWFLQIACFLQYPEITTCAMLLFYVKFLRRSFCFISPRNKRPWQRSTPPPQGMLFTLRTCWSGLFTVVLPFNTFLQTPPNSSANNSSKRRPDSQ